MQSNCETNLNPTPSGFIGYQHISQKGKEIIRIFINCKDPSNYEGTVDVHFEDKVKFSGLEDLSMIKKFHRFIGCLEERAREINLPRERVFESSDQLLYLLSQVKNSKKI